MVVLVGGDSGVGLAAVRVKEQEEVQEDFCRGVPRNLAVIQMDIMEVDPIVGCKVCVSWKTLAGSAESHCAKQRD